MDRTGKAGAQTAEQARFVNLISRMSHDLKAPVHAMAQIASWIEEELAEDGGGDRATIAEYISLLKKRSARAELLITNLRVYTQVGQTGQMFEGNWNGLLARVATQVRGLGGFDLITHLQGVPSIASNDLEVLIEALVSNAAKHHDTGQGAITLTCERHQDRHVISVTDDGPGIPLEHRAKAMEMFVTLNGQDKIEGSGLGLSIAARIADHYGGGLSIANASSGQGCCATVWFPA